MTDRIETRASRLMAAALVVLALALLPLGSPARAQQEPRPDRLRHGALTGGLAASSESALLAQQIMGSGHQRQGRAPQPAR